MVVCVCVCVCGSSMLPYNQNISYEYYFKQNHALNNCSSSRYNLYSYEKFSQVKGITTDKKYERGLKYIIL